MRTNKMSVAAMMLAGSAMLSGCSQNRAAPALKLDQWISPAGGEAFDLSAHRGKPVLLEFWATW